MARTHRPDRYAGRKPARILKHSVPDAVTYRKQAHFRSSIVIKTPGNPTRTPTTHPRPHEQTNPSPKDYRTGGLGHA